MDFGTAESLDLTAASGQQPCRPEPTQLPKPGCRASHFATVERGSDCVEIGGNIERRRIDRSMESALIPQTLVIIIEDSIYYSIYRKLNS